MPFHTVPNAFSITALMGDQVALLARSRRLSPGAASILLGRLMKTLHGRRHLMRALTMELAREVNPVDAAAITEVCSQTRAWVADLDRATPSGADGGANGAAKDVDDEANATPPAPHAWTEPPQSAIPRSLVELESGGVSPTDASAPAPSPPTCRN